MVSITNMKIEFSIIIPIYNPKYDLLKESIDCVLKQLKDNDELVCVLNGNSKEQNKTSLDIIGKHKNVITFIIDEGDVSTARNKGIELAKNEYLIFLDYDDLISENMLNVSRNILEKKDYDFICFGDTENKESLDGNNFDSFEVDKDTYLKVYQLKENELPMYFQRRSIQSKIYKKSLINKIGLKFNVHQKLAQDTPFTFEYVLNCKTFLLHKQVMYYYRINEGGNTVKPCPDAINRIDVLIGYYESILKRYKLGNDYYHSFYFEILFNYYPYIFRKCIFDKRLNNSFKTRYKLIKQCNSKEIYKKAIKCLKLKDAITKKQRVFLLLLKLKLSLIITCVYNKK